MTKLHQFILSTRVREPARYENLTLFPLATRFAVDKPNYLLLDEALERRELVIEEVSEVGEVPELMVTNHAAQPVLLLDGEELVGAKQNRVLNLTVLVAADSSLRIPVSCVEAGRWSYATDKFHAAPHAQYASGRASRVAQVNTNWRDRGRLQADQCAVWDDIAAKAHRMCVSSGTQAMRDIFKEHRLEVEDYVRAFGAADGQCGALFAIGEEVVGLDLFDSPVTLAKVLPKLIRSYALDAIETLDEDRGWRPPRREAAERFLEQILAARPVTAPAVGEGTNLRLETPALTGGALACYGRILHLYAFPRSGQPDRRGGTRITRAAHRGRR